MRYRLEWLRVRWSLRVAFHVTHCSSHSYRAVICALMQQATPGACSSLLLDGGKHAPCRKGGTPLRTAELLRKCSRGRCLAAPGRWPPQEALHDQGDKLEEALAKDPMAGRYAVQWGTLGSRAARADVAMGPARQEGTAACGLAWAHRMGALWVPPTGIPQPL